LSVSHPATAGRRRIAQLSFFFLRRSFFAHALQKFGGHRPPLQKTLANEVERSNILAPGVNPSSRLHRRLMATIGLGKSYPVTAAQLLPVSTGFLAPIHFFKLAKNWDQD
jgi:hypothetical protein